MPADEQVEAGIYVDRDYGAIMDGARFLAVLATLTVGYPRRGAGESVARADALIRFICNCYDGCVQQSIHDSFGFLNGSTGARK